MSRTLTENKAPTFDSSSDPRVDFFFHITEDAANDKTIDLLSKSWDCHPLDTLKLIAFLRDCRNGKGIRRQYHICLYWIFSNHYNTLVANIDQLVSFGYWKDLLHLLMVLLFDGLIPDYMSRDDGGPKKVAKRGRKDDNKSSFPLYDRLILRALKKERQKLKKELKGKNGKVLKTNKVSVDLKESEKMEVKETIDEELVLTVPTRSQSLRDGRRTFAEKRYKSDDKYRKLYDQIVVLFSNQLKIDLEKMSKNVKSITLAAKWTPTNGNHFDKYLDISQPIARHLAQLMERQDINNNPKLLAEFYQKEVCSPLRRYLKIPEVLMSSKQWTQIDYNRVASKCMQKNKNLFIKYDKQRFDEYLASKKTISGSVLKPVEMVDKGFAIIHRKYGISDEELSQLETETQVLEKQWLSLSEDIQKKGGGLFGNAIAVCDVSGSMNGTPMSAANGLTILVMSLSEKPWNSVCITFSESPELHVVDPNLSFIDKLQSIQDMGMGYNTDLNLVFKLILDKAVEQRLTNEQLPKLIVVFTDMEFDNAFPNTSMTNFEAAKQMFETFDYRLPPIVFWNLRSNTSLTSTPVQTNQLGAALLSGYSGQQLSLLLKTKDMEKISPLSMMRSAIDDNRYSKLKIID